MIIDMNTVAYDFMTDFNGPKRHFPQPFYPSGLFDKENNLLAVAKYPETLKQKASGDSSKTIMLEIQIELSDSAINTIIIK